MASRFPPNDAVLKTAAAWASGFGRSAARLWNEAVLCVPVVVLIMRIAMAAIARFPGRKTIAVSGLAAASFFGAFEYHSHYAAWTGTPAAKATNDGAEDFASFNSWKRSVEETLKAAALREQQDRAKSSIAVAATKPDDVSREDAALPIDLGVDREVARPQPNTLNRGNESNDANEAGRAAAISEAGAAKEDGPAKQANEPEPFLRSPVIDPVLSGRLEAPRRRPGRHTWGPGRWHGRRYGWSYDRLIGVARAFPFVLSVR